MVDDPTNSVGEDIRERMHMSLERRVPLLLDQARYRRVSGLAQSQGVSVAAIIRKAIDAIPPAAGHRRQAVDAILAAEPMPVPVDPANLRRELDRARARERRIEVPPPSRV